MAIAQPIAAYDEVLDFLASTPTLEQIIAFRPSGATRERVRYLLDMNRAGTLTAEEEAELDQFEQVENLMRMLKIKAREKLAAA